MLPSASGYELMTRQCISSQDMHALTTSPATVLSEDQRMRIKAYWIAARNLFGSAAKAVLYKAAPDFEFSVCPKCEAAVVRDTLTAALCHDCDQERLRLELQNEDPAPDVYRHSHFKEHPAPAELPRNSSNGAIVERLKQDNRLPIATELLGAIDRLAPQQREAFLRSDVAGVELRKTRFLSVTYALHQRLTEWISLQLLIYEDRNVARNEISKEVAEFLNRVSEFSKDHDDSIVAMAEISVLMYRLDQLLGPSRSQPLGELTSSLCEDLDRMAVELHRSVVTDSLIEEHVARLRHTNLARQISSIPASPELSSFGDGSRLRYLLEIETASQLSAPFMSNSAGGPACFDFGFNSRL